MNGCLRTKKNNKATYSNLKLSVYSAKSTSRSGQRETKTDKNVIWKQDFSFKPQVPGKEPITPDTHGQRSAHQTAHLTL